MGQTVPHLASPILQSTDSCVSTCQQVSADVSVISNSSRDMGEQHAQSMSPQQPFAVSDSREPGHQQPLQPVVSGIGTCDSADNVQAHDSVFDVAEQTGVASAPTSQSQPQDSSGKAQAPFRSPVVLEEAMAIELFAGSANLGKAFRSIGMQVVAVDTKDAPQIKMVKLNLLHKGSVDLVHRLLQTRNVILVHMAPPCSTSSQARRIRRSPRDPKPLRSWCMPDGLDNLGFLDRTRVSQANRLYHVCHDVAVLCARLGIWWSIANPTSSLMWITTPFRHLWQELRRGINFATFHNCVYGGDRKKSTTIWTSCARLQGLSCACHKDDHVRKEWGRQRDGSWATSQEAAYPPALCSQFASLVLQAAQEANLIEQNAIPGEVRGSVHLTRVQSGHERASQGLFPRGLQAPRLVDPFPRKEWVQVPDTFDRSVFVPGKRLSNCKFPKGSTTLSVKHEAQILLHVGSSPQRAQDSGAKEHVAKGGRTQV